jgi:hypothetical protein
MPTDCVLPPGANTPSVRQRIPGQDVLNILYKKLPINQFCGSHDILVRIRIRESVPLTNGSGSGFLKVQLHHFSKIKSHNEVTKQ